MVNIQKELRRIWRDSAPLTAVGLVMLVDLLFCIAGIILDERIITGARAWIKPAKFAISVSIYSLTVAWLFRYLTIWPRFVRAMGWVIAVVFVIEIAIIDLQAARGTTSHFNVSTALDGTLFSIMGASILVLLLASIGILVALFRQRFEDASWGWALRLGMLITVLGSSLGGAMTRLMPDQAEALRTTHQLTRVGAHTVGAPDGGPGLAGVGWSTEHGDLRIPHFFGMHGVQIVPLLGWLFSRRRTFAIAGSYLSLLAILTWQAFRGQPLIHPDGATLTALAIWGAASAIFLTR